MPNVAKESKTSQVTRSIVEAKLVALYFYLFLIKSILVQQNGVRECNSSSDENRSSGHASMSDSGGGGEVARDEPRRTRQQPHARTKHRPHNKVKYRPTILYYLSKTTTMPL